jgi:hypothetical protein
MVESQSDIRDAAEQDSAVKSTLDTRFRHIRV